MPALCRAWMGLADCTSERRWTSQQLPRFHNSHMLLQLVNHSLRHTIPVLPATAALARPTRLFSSEAATATTHYEVLGVERSAAPAVIKKAFRQVCAPCQVGLWPNTPHAAVPGVQHNAQPSIAPHTSCSRSLAYPLPGLGQLAGCSTASHA